MEIALSDLNIMYANGNVFNNLAKEYDHELFYRYSIQSHSVTLLLYILKYNQIPYDLISLEILNNGIFIQDIEALGGFPDASTFILDYYKDKKNIVMVPDHDIDYFISKTEQLQEAGLICISYIPVTNSWYNLHFFQKLI